MSIAFELLPNALGFYREWGGGAPDHTAVADANDGTLHATNGGHRTSYAVAPLAAGATEVIGPVTVEARLDMEAGWNGLFLVGARYVKPDGSAVIIPAFEYFPTTSPVTQSGTVAKPDGTPWTPAEVNALQPVVDVLANFGGPPFDYTKVGRLYRTSLKGNYNDVPPAPSNLTAVVANPNQVDLAWTDNATNETGFKVERADGPGGAFVQIATPAVNATTHSDTTAKPNIQYTYRVRATNASGDSAYSNTAVVSVGVVAPDQTLFTKDNANARFEVIENVKNHGYEAGVFVGLVALRFDIGGGEIGPINFNPSYDSAKELAAAVQTAMRAAGSGNEVCTYSNSTHLFTVSKPSGTLSLKFRDSTYKHINGWRLLGFNEDTDKTGSLSYASDRATFEAPDKDHILLVSCNGFRDDTSGTYTGTASGRIEKAPDVSRVLIERYAGHPAARFNAASYASGRQHPRGAAPVYVFIQDREDLATILERLENGALADNVMDSEGVLHWVPYSDTTVRRSFFDRDFLSFKARRPRASMWKGVRVHYGLQPHNGRRDVVETISASVPVLRGVDVVKDLVTYVRDKVDAEALLAQAFQLAIARPIEVEFTSRSKLVDLKKADVIELTRSRCAVSPTGALAAVKFKVAALRHDYGTGVSYCSAVEQVTLT